ncbi:MAG: glycoside hydrolase family 88 protein [Lachnospiraceae bacterium]|nr:glycoside hydrolase family 88 protein [Lachnospiraceae bacterium]
MDLNDKLNLLASSFTSVLYEEDETFLKNMEKNNLAGDDIRRYQFWEWTQGVGLFGFWKLYKETGNREYVDILLKYYNRQMGIGFPAKNVNTVTPLLAMCLVGQHEDRKDYLAVCDEWAKWIYESFPRTKEGGFQHITSDTLNDSELWDDTLYMTVLFLAQYGVMTKNDKYIEEAVYQFLLHIKYLTDRKTGMWFHGWSFNERGNFAEALWGRGNCWITMAIPEFLSIVDLKGADRRFLVNALLRQAEALKEFQSENGMWHTLVDDPTSYVESSATCGFAYGLLKAVHMGLIPSEFEAVALKALDPIIGYINAEGVVEQVSYGTPMGRKTKDFYKEIPIKSMPYGQALAMLFLMEVMKGS